MNGIIIYGFYLRLCTTIPKNTKNNDFHFMRKKIQSNIKKNIVCVQFNFYSMYLYYYLCLYKHTFLYYFCGKHDNNI